MRIKNARLFPTALAFGKTAEGASFLSVVIKGTFHIPSRGGPARPTPIQLPIFTTDEPYDPKRPGGLIKFESDLVPFKPRTDVVLVGHAYAPRGIPAKVVSVEIEVGALRKRLRVFGERAWSFPFDQADGIPYIAGATEFAKMPLTWDRAFGGIDKTAPIVGQRKPWCERNYLGMGFCGARKVASIDRTPLPNIEDPDDLIRSWDSYPRPAGCGFFPRNSRPRSDWWGTYDEKWQAQRKPELPLDFRFDAYNGADFSMQLAPYLGGNERVRLANVAAGRESLLFTLPCLLPQVTAATEKGLREIVNLDSLVILPDSDAFYVAWRAIVPVEAEGAPEIREVSIQYSDLAPVPWHPS
ncbi:MAG TPA: DUF2169 domain-containing protein [Polyangiaceae bacterium]|nr:DUF2169 domain-containing protein [Polyangiaceae bacterium]